MYHVPRAKRPHPAADLPINFKCGCVVRFLAATDYSSAKVDNCDVHESAEAAGARALIWNIAASRKRAALMLGW